MGKPVIKVEGVSKKYIIGHESNERYTTLREAIAKKFRKSERLQDGRVRDNRKEEFLALHDVNFEVQPGECVGIIGRNGAGKSTLLKILSRITEPTAGRVSLRGRVASLLEVGTGFHPELSGRENIFLNGAILGMARTEIRRKFDEIVDFAEVEKFLDTPVKRYSSGMYVRLAFAVAAHLEPEILVVDEVLAVGDAQFQKKCLGKMGDVSQGEGRTVLFVSHNMMAVKSLCRHGIFLKEGQVNFNGPIDQAINKYQLIFSPSMSRVFDDQDLRSGNEKVRLNSVEIELDNDDAAVTSFMITRPLKIHVKLSNIAIDTPVNVNIFFNAPDGSNIFATVSMSRIFERGLIHLICEIPANFLNDNIYILDVMVVTNDATVLFVKEVITLEGSEPARNSAWLGKFPGYLRPSLNWQIQ
jgi:lipopolysaccharide transport system ATP-binding protein